MSDSIVNLAVIGCGDIVQTQHLPAITSNRSVRLVAVCDTDLARAEAVAKAAGGGVYALTDYKQLLADKSIQAVLVCTPPWVTPAITIDALHAGKDVLCEKPMAPTLEAAERMAEAEQESGRLLQVGFTYRHGPLMDALQGWIRAGRLGCPLQLRLSTFDEAWDPEGNPEHYNRILQTLRHGPPCIHDGAHAADHLSFLTGSRPVKVTAHGVTSRPEFPASNYNAAWIEFESGDCAKLEVAWFYPQLPAGEFQMIGPNGMAYLDRAGGEAVLVTDRAIERIKLNEDRARSCFRVQLEKFVHYIRTRQTPVPGSREGLASLKLTLAIVHAMETGQPVLMKQEDAS